jgi:GNAT superfamily N-acetyltransferase
MSHAPTIRPGRDADAEGFIALIAACWSQYPGVLMDVDGELPELRALASYYAAQGGALWAAEDAAALVGMIASKPLGVGDWEICKVYVHPDRHGSGLGHALLDQAESHAIAAGASRLKLWSDTRFDRAHRFYEKRSYIRSGPIRVLQDISHSLEFAYAKPVHGIEVLDAAAASSAIPRLSALLATAAHDARTCLIPPPARQPAPDFWRATARQVATGEHLLLAGWINATLAATLGVVLGGTPDQQHRAEFVTMLADPEAGTLAGPLLAEAEREALARGRTLLTLRTGADGAGDTLCRAAGWQPLGRIPGYEMRPEGTLDDARFFWKRLA